jgi:NSS family neurotransmitter:Na+ symporter
MSSERGGFSRIGFIMAAAGSAVGLGNIWKYPFEVSNGGGAAFVITYLLICFIFCFPIMVAEIAIGRKTGLNPVGAFKKLGFPKWSIIGYMGILTGVLILSFYNVVAGWAFGYFLEMVGGKFDVNFGTFVSDISLNGIFSLLFMFFTAIIVSKGIKDGVEKASNIMMPALFVILIILIIYSFTLPNGLEGVKYYLVPDFDKLTLKTIYSAMNQAFFSLSLGMGALITYGSYMKKEDNIIKSAVLVTIMDSMIAFLAGLMIFAFVFYQGADPNNGGPGLVFVTLPVVFNHMNEIMPFLGNIIGGLFFLLLSFAALTSTISLLEVPVTYIVDEHKIERKKAVWGMATLIFIIGIPSMFANGYSEFFSNFIKYFGAERSTDFMTFINHITDVFLPLGGLLISTFCAYIWKKENFFEEIKQGYPGFTGSLAANVVNFGVSFLGPFVLSILFVLTLLNRFFGVIIF